MRQLRARVGPGGRIVIPVEVRAVLGVDVGDELLLRLDGDELRIFTPEQAIRRAQELVRRHVPENRSLAAELISERRAEAGRE